jgi:hypothetical protein
MTVVILRQNTRQKLQSSEDAKNCKAHENMWYNACTQQDIVFLCTHTTGPGTDRSKLAEKDFCNVSIIIAWNSQKYELGSV